MPIVANKFEELLNATAFVMAIYDCNIENLYIPETMVLRLRQTPMARSSGTIVYICKINGFPCIVSRQRTHVEPFAVQRIHHHHLNHDLPFRESEERISMGKYN